MCVPYYAHEMLAGQIDRGATDLATLPVSGATWDDLDPLEFERVRRLVGESRGEADPVLATLSDQEIARALGTGTDDDRISIGSLLLLSAVVYRALESSAGYVGVRGFDRLQQEQMVLAFVDGYGRITRAVAELCSLAPEQATRLLRRLVDAGQLVRHGQRKGSYYQRLAAPDA
jgi:hypothetical protein